MSHQTILKINRSEMDQKSKPIYLLANDAYIALESDRKQTTTKVNRCFCSACNTLFELDHEIEVWKKDNAHCRESIPELSEFPWDRVKKTQEQLQDVKCPNEDCGNAGVYAMLPQIKTDKKESSINMDGAYVTPYILQKRELSVDKKDDAVKSINDSSDYDSVIIYPSGKTYTRHINYTECMDLNKKCITLTKSGTTGVKTTKLYSCESESALKQNKCLSFAENITRKHTMINGMRSDTSPWGQNPNFALEREMTPSKCVGNDSISVITANKAAVYGHSFIMCMDNKRPRPAFIDEFMNRSSADMDIEFARAKRSALEDSFRSKTGALPYTEQTYLSGRDNKLYLSQIKPQTTERDFESDTSMYLKNVSAAKFAAYTDFMVRYPVAFDFICQASDEEIKNRARKTLETKDQPTTDANIQAFIETLPQSAIAKSFRNNFENISAQVYHADDKIKTSIQQAKSVNEMLANMRYFAFGDESVVPGISDIQKPSVIKTKNRHVNTMIQNDPDLVSEFNKNPIGFANTVYSGAKMFSGADEQTHYSFVKNVEQVIHDNDKLPKAETFCSTEYNTIVVPKSPLQTSMLRAYASIHGPEKTAEFFRHSTDLGFTSSNMYTLHDVDRNTKRLERYNASLVLFDGPSGNDAESRLDRAMTIDEFNQYSRLKEYLSNDSSLQSLNEDSVKSAYFDFLPIYKEKTQAAIDSCADDIRNQRPVYIKLNNGQPIMSASASQLKDILGSNGKLDCVAANSDAIYSRDHDTVSSITNIKTSDGIRYDAIETPADYIKCMYSLNRSISNRKTYVDQRAIIVGTYEATNEPVAVLSVPLPGVPLDRYNDYVYILSDYNKSSNPVSKETIDQSVDEYLGIIAKNEGSGQKLRCITAGNNIKDEIYIQGGHFRQHGSFIDRHMPDGSNTDGQAVREGNRRQTVRLAEQIYGRDPDGNIQIPDPSLPTDANDSPDI